MKWHKHKFRANERFPGSCAICAQPKSASQHKGKSKAARSLVSKALKREDWKIYG
jgi:hypothetical protein